MVHFIQRTDSRGDYMIIHKIYTKIGLQIEIDIHTKVS